MTAATGAEGLALFAACIPDIVLVDLALPDMDGCDVIRRMRSVAPATLIVAHSGFALRDSALAAGANAFVLKPNLEALEEVFAQQHAAVRAPAGKTSA